MVLTVVLIAGLMLAGPGLTLGVLALRGPSRQWQAPRPPEVALVDDRPVLVGPHTRTGLFTEQELRVGVWDVDRLELAWESPVLGTIAGGDISRVHAAAMDQVVVTTSGSAQLATWGLADGALRHAVEMSDYAVELCIAPDRSVGWATGADGRVWQLDGATGAISKGGSDRARACAARETPPPCHVEGSDGTSDCHPAEAGVVRRHHSDLGDVEVGTRHPGTPWPRVARPGHWTWSPGGVDRPDLAPGAPPASAWIDGDVVLVTVSDHTSHLVRLDGETGRERWRQAIPDSDVGSAPASFHVAAGRIWVPHWTYLDAFDLDTGTHLGTIGRWR